MFLAGRILRLPERQDVQEDYHLRLRYVLGRPAPEAEEPVPGGEEERRSIASTASMVSIVSIASLDQWFPFCTTTGPPSPAVPPTPQPRRRLYLPLTQNKGIFSALLQFVR